LADGVDFGELEVDDHEYKVIRAEDLQGTDDQPPSWMSWTVFEKLPLPVHMTRVVDEECYVETAEGTMHAAVGDWLCYDEASGHLWPISNDYKESHYTEVVK
jgi:hypothetical protein